MIVTCRSLDGGVDIIEGMIFVFFHLGFLGTIYVEAQGKQGLIPYRLINFLLTCSTILQPKQEPKICKSQHPDNLNNR